MNKDFYLQVKDDNNKWPFEIIPDSILTVYPIYMDNAVIWIRLIKVKQLRSKI